MHRILKRQQPQCEGPLRSNLNLTYSIYGVRSIYLALSFLLK